MIVESECNVVATLATLIVASEVRYERSGTLAELWWWMNECWMRIKVSLNSLKLGTIVVHSKLIFLYLQISAKQNFYGFTRCHLSSRVPVGTLEVHDKQMCAIFEFWWKNFFMGMKFNFKFEIWENFYKGFPCIFFFYENSL